MAIAQYHWNSFGRRIVKVEWRGEQGQGREISWAEKGSKSKAASVLQRHPKKDDYTFQYHPLVADVSFLLLLKAHHCSSLKNSLQVEIPHHYGEFLP